MTFCVEALERRKNGFELVWKNSALSRERLGYAQTGRQLKRRLERCHSSKRKRVQKEIKDSGDHKGDTVFDWIVDIIRIHGDGGQEASDNVVLRLE